MLFAGVSVSLAALCTVGCADDNPFGEKFGELPDRPVFGVSMSSSWQTGQDATRSGVTVSPLEGDSAGQALYLVTEVADINDSVAAPPTRGSKLENVEAFVKTYTSFGLSGICYSGEASDDVSGQPVNLVNNVRITKKGTYWETPEPIYWPGSGRMRFFAYAPYPSAEEGLSVSGSKGAPVLTFEVKDKVAEQTDLLTAVKDVPGNGGGAINLEFGHALSAIQFKTGDAMLGGKVKSVTLSGVGNKGTHVIGSGVWTVSGSGSYVIEKEGDYVIKDKDNEAGEEDRKDNHYTDKDQVYSGVDDNLTLFMIPQTLPEGAKLTMGCTDELTGLDRT
ncbi:MAG: fimbrillin family protein, partial [Muribaculaceae bacterium]|nr:fimbrillin family protein [Muribaculaceae bacterium]